MVSGAYRPKDKTTYHSTPKQGSTWTADDLAYLKASWLYDPVEKIAEALGRSVDAVIVRHNHEMLRPEAERYTVSAERYHRAYRDGMRASPDAGETRRRETYAPDPDEGAWWEADYYKRREDAP